MLGNAAIVHFLEGKGVQYIFHLPGIHTLPLYRALKDSKVKVLVGRHESNVAFMADGFARATGRPAFILVTPGPGLGNVVTACMEAYSDDVPLIIIGIEVEQKDVEKGILHGVREPEALFRHISKGLFVISDEKRLVTALEAAFRAAESPRQGPVVVSIPYRLLEREVPFPELENQRQEGASLDLEHLERALEGTERPVIIGGGALMEEGPREILDALCRESAIPFLATPGGKGALREDAAYVFGNVAARGIAREILRRADVAIALGTRLRAVDTKRRGVKLGRLVHIDVDDQWLGRNYRASAALSAGMEEAVEALCRLMKSRRSSWDMEKLGKAREREEAGLAKNHEGFRIVRLLRQSMPPETVTVWDLSLIAYWAEYYFPVYCQRSFLSPRGISPIFYAFPACLGAKLGRPGTPCLSVNGDGSFCAVAGELATIRQYDIPIVILVHNNGGFGMLEDSMRRRYAVEETMHLYAPDFTALARAFGIRATRAESLEDLRRVLLHEIAWDEPHLVEFRHPAFPPPW
jgi:thiamine pyrophosphate-dependent acetolactate synthase large subunit-like protein